MKKTKSTKKTAAASSKKTKKPAGGAPKAILAAKAAASFVAVAPNPALANLDKIEHIIVLMLENRSKVAA